MKQTVIDHQLTCLRILLEQGIKPETLNPTPNDLPATVAFVAEPGTCQCKACEGKKGAYLIIERQNPTQENTAPFYVITKLEDATRNEAWVAYNEYSQRFMGSAITRGVILDQRGHHNS